MYLIKELIKNSIQIINKNSKFCQYNKSKYLYKIQVFPNKFFKSIFQKPSFLSNHDKQRIRSPK